MADGTQLISSQPPSDQNLPPAPAAIMTLRMALLVFSAVILLLSVGGMLVGSQWLGREEAEGAAKDRMREVATRITNQTTDLLARATETVEQTRRMANAGILNFADKRFTPRYFLEMVARDPILEGIYVTDQAGQFTFATRDPANRQHYIAKEVAGTPGSQTASYFFFDETLRQSDDAWLVRDDFLPKSRPWYRLAMAGQTGWTDPYVFWTTGQIGISTARQITCPDGRPGCVIGADFTLVGLSRFLADQHIGANAASVILTPEGGILAHSDLGLASKLASAPKHHNEAASLPQIEVYGDQRLLGAIKSLPRALADVAQAGLTYVSFSQDGTDYIAAFTPFHAGDRTWIVADYAPRANFIGWFTRLQHYQMLLAAILFFALVSVCLVFYRSLASALGRLQSNAAAVATGRFAQLAPPQSSLDDFRALESAMLDMADAIQREQQTTRFAMAQAIQASQAKSNFLAHMSHEFRTPLNAIVGFAEFLALLTRGKLTAKEASYLQDIGDAAQHLTRIINDTLDLVQIESGHMALQIEEASLSDVIDRALRLAEPLATERHVVLARRPATDLALRVDPRRLRQAILNIVINAIKYSKSGGHIDIQVEHDQDHIDIRVIDQGIGMSASEINRALEPFGRIVQNPHVAQQGGVGLGISITRALMEAHSGALHVASTPGMGTVVTLRLPASCRAVASSQAASG